MTIKRSFLSIGALVCLAAAYRFASHGIPVHDNFCIGLACLAVAVAALLLWFAFRSKGSNGG